MALKKLMIRKQLETKKAELEALRARETDFEAREKELEASIEEVTSQEERDAVMEEIDKFEAEKAEHDQKVTDLDKEVRDLEADLEELEKKDEATPAPEADPEPEARKDERIMETRKFFGMNVQERDAFFAREDVKEFLETVRTSMKEKRAINNVGLLVPEVMLPLLRQVTEENSKLIGKVNKVSVPGTGRMNIMGNIPEAVWTEMCANLNELDLSFYGVEVDGYKVGGFIAVCNAMLEDSDIALATEIVNALGKAVGYALDKAIVFGTGTKMPLGIVTRLAQSSKPADYPAAGRAWVDYHSTHLVKTNTSGLNLFKAIVGYKKLVSNKYSKDKLVWLMSENTHCDLIAESIGANAAAAIVAGMNDVMPVIGGEIVELPFITDGDIVFGYLDTYLLAERAGTQIDSSEHARFLQDQTVFKGTARYDGLPVIAEAFAVCNIKNQNPTTTASFAEDTANEEDS